MSRRLLVTLGILVALGLGLLLLSYEVVGVEFADEMEHQPALRYEGGPRLLPPTEAIAYGRPAYQADPQTLANPVPADEVSLQRGQVLFSVTCAVCHGAGGKGDGPVVHFWGPNTNHPANLTDPAINGLPDGFLYNVVSHGLGAMPPIRENLTERQRWDVINHVRTLRP